MSAPLQHSRWDPVFLRARREAWIIFAMWAVCLLWSVPVCYWLGYSPPDHPDQLRVVWGFPLWAFWGILVPWLCADVATIVFCWKFMQDAPLDTSSETSESPAAEGGRGPDVAGE